MKISILSLFPQFFENLVGLTGTARESGIFNLDLINIRDFGHGNHHKVDDQIFGGGDGMLLAPEVIKNAVDFAKDQDGYSSSKVVALTPKGKVWTQKQALAWSKDSTPKILVCGRYAGFDQRFLESCCDEEISVGDFILNGGEVAALTILESVVRLLPNALGNELSPIKDSFSQKDQILECPQYTRPREWMGLKSPEILFSGHHKNIEMWTKASAVIETLLKRPELLIDDLKGELSFFLSNTEVEQGLKQVYSEQQLDLVSEWINS